jgi:hypothetical protein
MVHVDQPSAAEILEREAELQQELLEPEEFREFRGQEFGGQDTAMTHEQPGVNERLMRRRTFPEQGQSRVTRMENTHHLMLTGLVRGWQRTMAGGMRSGIQCDMCYYLLRLPESVA